MTNQASLKYLFEAELKDGTLYRQNKDDASVKFPPKQVDGVLIGKSCMSDIQEDVNTFRIKRFTLIEQVLLGKRISVDLTTGVFTIDGTDIIAEGDRPLPGPSLFKLIYFRIRRPQISISDKGILSDLGELPIQYMIGWQTEINGKMYTQKIIVQ